MRLLCLALVALALTACSFGQGGPEPKSGDLDAATMKSRVDQAARALAPDLAAALEAEVQTGGGTFIQCQMSSDQWEYKGSLGLVGAPVKDHEARLRATLEKAGYTIGATETGELVADKDKVRVHAQGPSAGSRTAVYNISIGIDCTPLDAEDEKVAESTKVNDWTT